MTTFVFSIGPVQGFISQSRRTADGWVGSYLLSFLVGHALVAVKDKAKVVEPDLKDVALYEKIATGESTGDTTIASLPNTLVLELKSDEPVVIGKSAADVVLETWRQVAKQIWDALPGQMHAKAVEDIWRRQVENHWEINWAWGDDSTAAFRHLQQRKGLRDFVCTEERGERCTVCGQREALWDEAQKGKRKVRDAARMRWQVWAPQLNSQKLAGGPLTPRSLLQIGYDDLQGKERLCAICLIKRLVPWTENDVSKLWPQDKAARTAGPPSVFPSTSTMATGLWRVSLLEAGMKHQPIREALDAYVAVLKTYGYYARADALSSFPSWEAIEKQAAGGWKGAAHALRMDGDWYLYGEAVRNEYAIAADKHVDIQGRYRTLLRLAKERSVEDPPIYWALLTMDGDNMGRLMEYLSANGQSGIASQILNRFANAVPGIVRDHDGRAIYAGGDDVLAFLPLKTALNCADVLRRKFADLFATSLPGRRATLSGSIVYAHHQAPLSAVIREGHALLERAKHEINGKNAVAIQHYQRGGPHVMAIAPWETNSPFSTRMRDMMDTLNRRDLASGLAYALRENAWLVGKSSLLSDADRDEYLAALMEKSRLLEGDKHKDRRQRARELAAKVRDLCAGAVGDTAEFPVEVLLMARFLAAGGREER